MVGSATVPANNASGHNDFVEQLQKNLALIPSWGMSRKGASVCADFYVPPENQGDMKPGSVPTT